MVVEEAKAPAVAAAAERGRRKTAVGMVTSAKMSKTIVVSIDRRVRHGKYEKQLTRQTTLKAHDDKGEAKEGDLVEVVETRPLSKSKRWRLVKILRKSQLATVTGALEAGDKSKAKGGHKGKEKADGSPETPGAAEAGKPASPAKETGKK